eukprot:7064548-Prymnesium_polylepis.1
MPKAAARKGMRMTMPRAAARTRRGGALTTLVGQVVAAREEGGGVGVGVPATRLGEAGGEAHLPN